MVTRGVDRSTIEDDFGEEVLLCRTWVPYVTVVSRLPGLPGGGCGLCMSRDNRPGLLTGSRA